MARPLVLAICALGTACVVVGAPPPDTAVQWLKARAGSDFDCPSSEVTTVTLDDKTKVATGGGFSAKYVLVCDRRMDWLLTAAVNGPVLRESDCAWKFDSSVESPASQRPGNERLAPRPFARCAPPQSPDSSGSDAGARPTSPVLGADEQTDAGLSQPIWDADRTVASLRPEFRRCYQAGLSVDGLMQGCVMMVARISAEGEVTSGDTIRREGLSPAVEACLVDVVKRARFTAPGGGGSTLQIPVTFVVDEPRRP